LFKQVTENAELRETVGQLRQEISSLKAAKSEDSFASVQSSEPSTASTDTKDNTNELSNHANVSSRTTEGNESGLISQVLKQVKSICPYVITFLYSSSVLSSFMICQLKPKNGAAGFRN